MDRIVRRNPRVRLLKAGAASALAIVGAVLVWQALPRGVAVSSADLSIATVQAGIFQDELVSRAAVVPLGSVMLDATEGGRVEAVLVQDGAFVKKGDLLFRLSNPHQEQEVLTTAANVAQQLANLSSQRAALADIRARSRRELAGLEYDLERAAKTHARNVTLAAQEFISLSALEESADHLAHARRLLEQTRVDSRVEVETREQSLKQMDTAINGLSAGLKLMQSAADGLSMRAPSDGVLTGFDLQVGISVKPADRLGRIDTPDRFKITAAVDEFYLSRVSPGLKGSVDLQGKTYALTLSRLNSVVKDGRFSMELNFVDPPPVGLQPGRSVDARLTLGQPSKSLKVRDGAFYADTGGTWAYVLDATGQTAERRTLQLGRRSAGYIEVIGGIRAGESVIVSSYKRFGEAQKLRLVK